MVNKKTTIDDLAIVVNAGFEGVNKQFEGVNKRLKGLERGQEQIKLRLDNVAYRFELVELERRVKRMELKLGLKSS